MKVGTEQKQVFDHLAGLVKSNNVTPYQARRDYLLALRKGIVARKDDLIAALNADFDGRSSQESILADIIPTLGIIDYTIKRLAKWMAPQKRHVALHFMPARNRVEYHPKGLVLIISPWNYPISLSLLPLASALAAGNRVIIKPSECTPKTSQITAELVAEYLPADRVRVLKGPPQVSIDLCKMPFDHIMFTGSSRVGREVMKSAAENLTPVTLELGGKSPAVVQGDYDFGAAAMRIARGKLLNGGQTCVAPDYVMVPEGRVPEFAAQYERAVAKMYPRFAGNSDYSSIINQRQFDRLRGMLEDAHIKGAKITVLGEEGAQSGKRKLHPHVIENISPDMEIAREEIFGPLLPVLPYANIEAASDYINQRARPLALYYFDNDRKRIDAFLGRTISGGAAINDTVLQFTQEDLPFGGSGASGMGVCHGVEGFYEFSHAKAVFHQAKFNPVAFLDPPYGKMFEWVAKFLLK